MVWLTLPLTLILAGCIDSLTGGGGRRDPGSVLWVSPDSGRLPVEDRDRLAQLGIGELFVEIGELAFSGSRVEVVPLPAVDLPRRTVSTLVVRGEWNARGGEAERWAEQLDAGLRQLKIEAESRGLLPLGFHLHLEGVRDLESYAEVVRLLAGDLERGLLLSLTVEPDWLGNPALAKLIRPLNYFVSFLYGQPATAPVESRYWDLDKLGETLAQYDELGRGYLVGIIGEGSLQLLSADGDVLEAVPSTRLRPLFSSTRLEADSAFLYEGFHRQVIDFEAQRPVRFADWQLRTGERVRVARPTAYHLADLRRRIARLEPEGHLGELYYRLPAAGEEHTLSLTQLMAALRPSPPQPDLDLSVALERDRRSRWTVRFEITNRGELETDFAAVEHNFVEARIDGGVFVGVELGDFKRMELSKGGRTVTSMRGVREADTLRLYYPLLDPGWTVASGPVVLQVESRDSELELRALFLLPDGRTQEVSRSWNPHRTESEE